MISMITLADRAEWLDHRKRFIGGSDASSIVGMNPYKTNTELWEEKRGIRVPEDISEKPYVKYGNDMEPLLRQIFALDHPEYEVFYEENNSWVNSEVPFAAASLDGWLLEKETGRKGVLEIKTTNILQSMQKEKWHNKIPDNYYTQVLHYFLVRSDCEFANLIALLKFEFDGEVYSQIRNYHIEREEVAEDIAFLAKAEREFAQSLKSGRRPALILPEV